MSLRGNVSLSVTHVLLPRCRYYLQLRSLPTHVVDLHTSWLHISWRPHTLLLQTVKQEEKNWTLSSSLLTTNRIFSHVDSHHHNSGSGRVQRHGYDLSPRCLLGEGSASHRVHIAHPYGSDAVDNRHTAGTYTALLDKVESSGSKIASPPLRCSSI